ncbi:hypothetical protein HN512_01570 [Candidatus Peregrinibacteria bacterium]|jgi:hypothetical protein|nr:hypothetical protein [Candidatus Peregrinibacteria bacterium]MBT3598503.1 hypothetical protein [Candidatus Peregrinibacteria bacterium]MBT4366811.1 hypothetical protein [Candidatus Peregrinibacteria bacterium]MBT4585432.1 hypothetical protein [Candidatus Peregrinibacteria bacterium]MBT6730720.1 hypothetical protein [Candidatus Peregrinibacteria bacterium]
MNPDRTEFKLDDGQDYPQDQNAKIFFNRLSPYGSFVRADPEKPGRNVIIIKHYHSRPNEIEAFANAPEKFEYFLRHQDAVYKALMAINNSAGDNGRFIMERLPVSLQKLTDSFKSELRQSAIIQNLRLQGDSTEYDKACQSILNADQDAAAYLQMVNGAQRFSAQCLDRADHLIIPGKSIKNMNYVSFVNIEINNLFQRVLCGQELEDNELELLALKIRESVNEDHKIDHQFVRQQVCKCPSSVHTVCIVYGGDHAESGYHESPENISKLPLEESFNDHRIFVFEPQEYSNVTGIGSSMEDSTLSPQNATADAIRRVLQSGLDRFRLSGGDTSQIDS